jgi:phenylacetic acid degradation operon negative regulatory protein
MKKINVSDWLSLCLAGVFDFLMEMRDPFGLISNYYQRTYGYVPIRFQRFNISHTLWRAIKTKRLIKKKERNKIFFYLSSLEEKRLKKKFPLLIIKNNQWDGFFRVVVYDIEEERKRVRDYLRENLKKFGFGMFQKSVWISPHNFLREIKKIIEKANLKGRVIYFETRNFYIKDIKELAKKIWPIEKLNEQYKELYNKLLKYYSLKKTSDRVKVLKSLQEKIINLYFQDPFLPKEFLPDDWKREEVVALVKKLKIFS